MLTWSINFLPSRAQSSAEDAGDDLRSVSTRQRARCLVLLERNQFRKLPPPPPRTAKRRFVAARNSRVKYRITGDKKWLPWNGVLYKQNTGPCGRRTKNGDAPQKKLKTLERVRVRGKQGRLWLFRNGQNVQRTCPECRIDKSVNELDVIFDIALYSKWVASLCSFCWARCFKDECEWGDERKMSVNA